MELSIQMYSLILPLTFLAGFIDAAAGGGGLISLPAYLAAGLPPHMAAATNKCSSTFGTLVAALRYLRQGRVHLPAAGSAAASALIGSVLGARLNLFVSTQILSVILLVAIPLVALLLALQRNFGHDAAQMPLSLRHLFPICILIGFFLGVYDGFFGPGTGTFLTLAFTVLGKFDLITAGGNTKIVNLASNTAALITFAFSGQILWTLGIPAACTGILGNYLGAGLAIKKGAGAIKIMLYCTLGLLMVKLIVDFL